MRERLSLEGEVRFSFSLENKKKIVMNLEMKGNKNFFFSY